LSQPWLRERPSMLVRKPVAALRPFVTLLWAADQRKGPGPSQWERVLPTGDAHLVFRLGGEPLRIRDDRGKVSSLAHAIVGGARSVSYLRDVTTPAGSVGAQLAPGATLGLFGIPAGELASRHTPLDALWGRGAEAMRERLAAAGPTTQLDLLEAALIGRLQNTPATQPTVAEALAHFRWSADVRAAVKASGRSHRRFIELFRESVGLSPKRFCRLGRFRRALSLATRYRDLPWVAIAGEAGYADQAHFNRDFLEFAGLSPGAYRAIDPPLPYHVPLIGLAGPAPRTGGKFRSRPDRQIPARIAIEEESDEHP
jgi:AraC-like DNA-binding protein